MRFRKGLVLAFAGLAILGSAWALQKPFREYPGTEYEAFPVPTNYNTRTEWTFARLMYPPAQGMGWGWGRRAGMNWKNGASNWTIDYPRSDRHLAEGVKRLTRINARGAEQPVDLDDGDDVYDWPWLYGVEVGHWDLSDSQAKKMREYLLRGGFFMCDDFHGTVEWEVFMESMKRVFPDRPVVEIPDSDPIFHVIYDLDARYQVPGAQYLRSGSPSEKDGYVARWRGIYDDKGRLMVAICHNMDLGDSWEWADVPEYPEKFSSLGIKIAVNYITYSMTH